MELSLERELRRDSGDPPTGLDFGRHIIDSPRGLPEIGVRLGDLAKLPDNFVLQGPLRQCPLDGFLSRLEKLACLGLVAN
jgi:hypothetical protein